MGTGWDQDIGLLHLIQIGSVKSVVKIGSGLYQGGDQKIGKLGVGPMTSDLSPLASSLSPLSLAPAYLNLPLKIIPARRATRLGRRR